MAKNLFVRLILASVEKTATWLLGWGSVRVSLSCVYTSGVYKVRPDQADIPGQTQTFGFYVFALLIVGQWPSRQPAGKLQGHPHMTAVSNRICAKENSA